MVHIRPNHGWSHRGLSLLWDSKILSGLVAPEDVLSLRDFFALANKWPDDLTAADGNAVVVAGMDGLLDVLDADGATQWIESDLHTIIQSFQDHFEGQAGLIFWLPSGRSRLTMNPATERYFWKHRPSGLEGLPLGRLLFSGAEAEVERIIASQDRGADVDGKDWVGLYHPRIS